MTAEQVVDRLQGMCLLSLATVSAADAGRSWGRWTGSSIAAPFTSARARTRCAFSHIRKRPQVSATHLPREEFARSPCTGARSGGHHRRRGRGFRQTLLEIYIPRYGAEWEEFLDSGPVYARIDAERMFTFRAPSA